jgi:cytosine/adenosine deaminase-related metal-dependent hydrolase
MPKVSGWIYTTEGFVEGTVSFEGGIVEGLSRQRERDVRASGLILPCFFNAHTHIGDSVVLEEPVGTLEELVAPPGGLKFRRLQDATREELVAAMRRTLRRMALSGTAAFCDFREGGVEGATALREALERSPVDAVVLGRPVGLEYNSEEMRALLDVVEGVAVSSVSDWDYGELEKLARHVREAGKLFALHASETRREDIDTILDLKPDFLVHMTAATEDDWKRCSQEGVPVVVCPRSQVFFGRVPDIPGMLDAGLTLLLGTDNAMLSSPSILREMEFAYEVAKLRGGVSPRAILRMAHDGAKLLWRPHPITIQEGEPCSLLVLDAPSGGDPYYQVIRATAADILLISLGRWLWLRDKGRLKEV